MLERSKKTYRLNGRLYMRGYSGSIKFQPLHPNAVQNGVNGSLKSVIVKGAKKVHNALKKVGPKIIHGAKKLLDFAASDPTVRQMISNAANQVLPESGEKVNKIIQTANNVVKDASDKKVNVNNIKDIAKDTKDIINSWIDNNKKVQAAKNIKPETKEQVQQNTEKLTEAGRLGRLGSIQNLKNIKYLNLLTKSNRGGSIGTSASVVKEIRDALGLPTTSIAQKGRMFLGDLKPQYLVSRITGNEYSEQNKKKSGVAGHDKSMPNPTKKDGEQSRSKEGMKNKPKILANPKNKGDIVSKFEALF